MAVYCNMIITPSKWELNDPADPEGGHKFIPAVEAIQLIDYSVGNTLEVYTKTYQVMSDIWEDGREARVWNPNTGKIETITWVEANSVADATPETLQAVREWVVANDVTRMVNDEKANRARISKGDMVEIVSGRSGKGSKGKVVVIMSANYRMGYRSEPTLKYGLALDDTKVPVFKNGKVFENYANMVWAYARNVKKLTPDTPISETEMQDFRKYAEASYNRYAWRA